MTSIKKAILNSVETKLKLANDRNLLEKIELAGRLIIAALKKNNKILIAGNGGSAADAQHFAAELAGQFVYQRKGLPAIALTTNSSIATAISNDFGYEHVFSRQLEGLGAKDDVFFGISTSGNSKNIILTCQIARQLGLKSIGLLGKNGGNMASHCDLPIIVPSSNTQAIQECHILIIHIICQMIDDAFESSLI